MHSMDNSAPIHDTHDKLSTVIQRSKDIADLVVMLQKIALLPAREITVFDGDLLTYQSFMQAF